MTSDTSRPAREPSTLDHFADTFLAGQAALDPILATEIGLPGHDHELGDLSPAGVQARADLVARTLRALAAITPTDEVDRITHASMHERLTVAADLHALGADLSSLNNVASPVQMIRGVFDLMPTDTDEDWATIATRLNAIPAAIEGYIESLRAASDVAPIRQVRAGIEQSKDNLGPDGFFATFVQLAPARLRSELDRASAQAQDGYQQLANFLNDELAAQAPNRDSVGIEEYTVHSRDFLGTTVDLAETYAWGQAELARITALMTDTAHQIVGGGTVSDAMQALDHDPARQLNGTAALIKWMQTTSDSAVAALAGSHFEIAEPVRQLECRLAPTHTGVIYYTGPSDDFSRPGRMWWSVPTGVTQFTTWRELTTVYHEGVPGHHLQIGQSVYRRDQLNSWRRLAPQISGHCEGWALYAERLMGDLGFLDDPGDRLGMLDGQSLRAARVVIDIGVHCGFGAPAEVGGGEWDYDKAWRYLRSHSAGEEKMLRFELDRYLGWPGQAPSYKVGERFWLQLRDTVQAREGDGFDLREFHRRALDIGSVGLDVLSSAIANEWPAM